MPHVSFDRTVFYCLVFAVSFTLVKQTVLGDPATPQLQEALTKAAAQWQSISSVQSTITLESTTKGVTPYSIRIQSIEDGNGNFYMDWMKSIEGAEDRISACTVAYDGKNYQYLMKGGNGRLKISKKIPKKINPFVTQEFITNPFWFCAPMEYNNNLDHPSLSLLRKSATYDQLLKTASSITNLKVNGKDCLSFQVPGGVDVDYNIPIVYEVYLSYSDGLYPIKIDKFTSSHQLMSEYDVTKIAYVKNGNISLGYPALATSAYYDYSKEKPTDAEPRAPTYTYKTTIDNVTINSADASTCFAIDPSIASRIEDLDTHTLINVPK